MKAPKVLLAHPGTQHSRYLAIELYKKGLLYRYCTGLIFSKSNIVTTFLLGLLPKSIKSKFNNRLVAQVPSKLLRTFPLLELKAIRQLSKPNTIKEEVFYKRNEIFQKKISSQLIKNCDLVIGFDTSAWILAQAAHKHNKKFILDQTTAEPSEKDDVLQMVAANFPDWKSDLQPRLKLNNTTDAIEQELANCIVVASTYTKETLIKRNISAHKIFINPYGTDVEKFTPTTEQSIQGKIKFLFVGSVSALKGIPLLLQAWKRLGTTNAELHIVGYVSDHIKKIIEASQNVKLLGSFSKEELPDIYRRCHVFVFPSYSDGFGQVILEAMACGLPVITTENTAGKDLIQDGKEGFVISVGKVDVLEETIRYFIDQPEEIKKMGKNARITAKEYTWERYGQRWQQIIDDVLISEV